jgi:hypothetical protein
MTKVVYIKQSLVRGKTNLWPPRMLPFSYMSSERLTRSKRGNWLLSHVDASNRLSQARFACVSSRYEANAYLNAAFNILAAGHAV